MKHDCNEWEKGYKDVLCNDPNDPGSYPHSDQHWPPCNGVYYTIWTCLRD